MGAEMSRPQGWESQLYDYIARCKNKQFEWGQFDCCTFACDWAIILGKPDPMEKIRGKYKTAKGAARAIARIIGKVSIEEVSEICDDKGNRFHRIPKQECGRGDVVLVSGIPYNEEGTGFDCSMGICLGPHCAVASETGILYVNRKNILFGWDG